MRFRKRRNRAVADVRTPRVVAPLPTLKVKTFSYVKRRGLPPEEATVVIDCRRLRNPGVPAAVHAMLVREAIAAAEADPGAVIAFGCDFGQQRSVATAEAFAEAMGGLPIEHTADWRVETREDRAINTRLFEYYDRW